METGHERINSQINNAKRSRGNIMVNIKGLFLQPAGLALSSSSILASGRVPNCNLNVNRVSKFNSHSIYHTFFL